MIENRPYHLIINKLKADAVLARLASQVVELLYFHPNLKILAVQPRGLSLARHICDIININSQIKIKAGKIDPTFYRDDIATHNKLIYPNESDVGFEIENQPVLLIDDVIFTGRTIRASMDALLDFGRPKWIKLMVLVNRHLDREIPISVDYEGIRIELDPTEKILIELVGSEISATISKEKNAKL